MAKIEGSSSIGAIDYDPANSRLSVTFASGGTHHYAGVPATIHQDFLGSPSKGGYFHRFIRGRYASEKAQEAADGSNGGGEA